MYLTMHGIMTYSELFSIVLDGDNCHEEIKSRSETKENDSQDKLH